MKRLLILTNKMPFPPRDGSSIAMASNIRGLRAQGAELCILTLNTAKHRVSPLPEEVRDPGIDWHILDVDTTPNPMDALLNLFSQQSFMVSRFHRRDVATELDLILKSGTFAAALVDGLFMMPYAGQLSAAGLPVVLRPHNVEHTIWERHVRHEANVLRRAYLRLQTARLARFELRVLAQVNLAVPITEEDAVWFRQAVGTDRVHVMPAGINTPDYPELGSEIPDLYHLGSMDWLPNVEGMRWFTREVWPRIRKQDNEAVFHLGGHHSEKLKLHRPEMGFFVHGTVESSRKFSENHGILVVPLHAGSGMRIKVMEGMMYGKAIVTTHIGVEGIPFEPGVHGIVADDPDAFAQAVADLLRNPAKRKTLGINARECALKHFDENRLAGRLIERLKEESWMD